MKDGKYQDGEKVLRAKIDMASPNINMRDPVIYRIRNVHHQRTGSQWCIYPMYDYTHCISDALENITHSLCTLEFEDHRPLYDWVLDQLADKVPCHPQQIEFARLNLTYTVMSKRKLIQLVTDKLVDGWDDPRLSTLVGVRRRGYTPRAIRLFAERIGVSKADSWIDMTVLEDCLREDLNESAPRRIAILKPLKLIIASKTIPSNFGVVKGGLPVAMQMRILFFCNCNKVSCVRGDNCVLSNALSVPSISKKTILMSSVFTVISFHGD